MYKNINSRDPVITIANGVKINGQFKGVLAVDLFLEDIDKVLGSKGKIEEVEHYILGKKGKIITHPIK